MEEKMNKQKNVTIKMSKKAFEECFHHATCGEPIEYRELDENGVVEGIEWYNAVQKGNYHFITGNAENLIGDLENSYDIMEDNVHEGDVSPSTYRHLGRVIRDLKRG
jgi:hypothetical protein